MKLLKAKVKNFKEIGEKEVEVNGRSFYVLGRNGGGKSSFLQAIASPANAKVRPLEPVKTGEKRAEVELYIGDGKENYTVDMTWEPNKSKGKAKVKDKNGKTVKGGKAAVDKIFGDISFDIMEFVSMAKTSSGGVSQAGVKKQVETMRAIVPDEVNQKLDGVDEAIKQKKEDKSYKKKRAEELKAQLGEKEFTQEEIDKYSEPIDTSEIDKEIEDVNNRVIAHREKKQRREKIQTDIQSNNSEIESLKEKIKTLEGQNKELEEEKKELSEYLEKSEEPSTERLYQKKREAEKHNEEYRRVSSYMEKYKEYRTLIDEHESLSEEIKNEEASKKQLFAEAKLPVENMTFDESGIYVDGLPLRDDQIERSRLIDIGCDMAMALNPDLKVIFIYDGSLLDEETCEKILQKIESNGYQCIMEMVSDDSELKIKEYEQS